MPHLVDSNMFLRWANLSAAVRPLAIRAMDKLRSEGTLLHSTPQNCIEFWNVATRPIPANGLGISPAQTLRLVNRLRSLFPLLPDTGAIFEEWLRIFRSRSVRASGA